MIIFVTIDIMDFKFMWGNMGSIVGEKIIRLVEYTINKLLPLFLYMFVRKVKMGWLLYEIDSYDPTC